jgi:hypothetical protein
MHAIDTQSLSQHSCKAACRVLVTLRFHRTWVVMGADAPTEWAKQHETAGVYKQLQL